MLFCPSRFICKSAGIVTLAAIAPSVCPDHSRRSEFLHPWPQLDLPRPGAARLMDEVDVRVGDRIGIERAVRTLGRIRPARASDTTVDHDVRDMDPLWRKLARHALGKSAERELAHREGRRLGIALHPGGR